MNFIILYLICLKLNFDFFFFLLSYLDLQDLTCICGLLTQVDLGFFFFQFLSPFLFHLIGWNLNFVVFFFIYFGDNSFFQVSMIIFCLNWSINYHCLFFYYLIRLYMLFCLVRSISQVIFFFTFCKIYLHCSSIFSLTNKENVMVRAWRKPINLVSII